MLDKVRNAWIVIIRRIPHRNSTTKHFIDGDGSTYTSALHILEQ